VALEQFKTQVLLLHSQQSTLDAMSAAFGDRYAVHQATTGTEALNTLGETPIHIIVSAQDLPGMSGLEALREAKKRSPDTIGILLAGNDGDDGLEALVGDKEVFQIVRGTITPEALQELIDAATKRVRMLTISESANDLAANVDEPVAEHIVMETSEHGSSIISTGRLPALKPSHVQIASNAGARGIDVLVLTKDEDFLATIRDSSNEMHTVHHANTPAQAEAFVREHKVGVLVTDAAMVGAHIEAITERLRKDQPRLVAVVAGRRDDGELLMDLINRGQVYRFLLKPVSPGRARLAIEASMKYHLEAADSAFKGKPRGESSAAVEARRPQSAKVARIAPRLGAVPHRKPGEAPARRASAAPSPEGRVGGAAKPEAQDGPDNPFSTSGRFVRNATGIAAAVGKSFAGISGAEETKAATNADSGKTSSPAALLASPKLLAIGASAVVAVAALAWWLFAASTAPDATPQVETDYAEDAASPSVVEEDIPRAPGRRAATPAEVPAPAYQEFLDEARIARSAGEIVAPPGSNAIELYVAAREIAPDEPVIVAELTETIDQAIGLAEVALLEQRTADAARALRVVRLADPENSRLPFLDAQVTQLQLRAALDQARVAIRERRFEDAATALGSAQTVAGGKLPEITLLLEELETTRSEQQVDEVLALASERLNQNALTMPANDNARYYYELALSNDPGNTVAQQGLTIVASKLVLRAREAIDLGQLDDAERFLKNATALDPRSADLSASLQALESAKAQRQEELEREASLAREAEADPAAEALPGQNDTEAEAVSPALETADSPDEALADTENPSSEGTGNGRAQSDTGPREYVAISTLKRTNYVAPDYPRTAQRRNITGWVDLSFTVDQGGSVVDVGILDSSPGDVFANSATEAVSQWRFEPSTENGVPVERLVAVRLIFDLE